MVCELNKLRTETNRAKATVMAATLALDRTYLCQTDFLPFCVIYMHTCFAVCQHCVEVINPYCPALPALPSLPARIVLIKWHPILAAT